MVVSYLPSGHSVRWYKNSSNTPEQWETVFTNSQELRVSHNITHFDIVNTGINDITVLLWYTGITDRLFKWLTEENPTFSFNGIPVKPVYRWKPYRSVMKMQRDGHNYT